MILKWTILSPSQIKCIFFLGLTYDQNKNAFWWVNAEIPIWKKFNLKYFDTIFPMQRKNECMNIPMNGLYTGGGGGGA